jgi:hypothetical protein
VSARTVVAVLLVAGLLLVANRARADRTMRCGNDFVEVGDTMDVVAKKCGPPDRIRQRTIAGATARVLVMWVYDFGRNRFLHVADFDDGRLVNVWTRGYGSKPPQ